MEFICPTCKQSCSDVTLSSAMVQTKSDRRLVRPDQKPRSGVAFRGTCMSCATRYTVLLPVLAVQVERIPVKLATGQGVETLTPRQAEKAGLERQN